MRVHNCAAFRGYIPRFRQVCYLKPERVIDCKVLHEKAVLRTEGEASLLAVFTHTIEVCLCAHAYCTGVALSLYAQCTYVNELIAPLRYRRLVSITPLTVDLHHPSDRDSQQRIFHRQAYNQLSISWLRYTVLAPLTTCIHGATHHEKAKQGRFVHGALPCLLAC